MDCDYQFVRTQRKAKNAELRKKFFREDHTRILPRVDDIVCEAEVIPEPKKR
jgi:hypothetical protein